MTERAAPPADALPKATAQSNASAQRKIIYKAQVELVVEQFAPLPAQIEELASQFEGFVASSNISGSAREARQGEWTLRVPVERYAAFLAAAQKLGDVRRLHTDSQDVTEEFHDLEARTRNKKQEEARLLKLLADATAELADVLAVEKELSRVREEIERMEGRTRLLGELISLTTVTLHVFEIRNYLPAEAPTYATRLRRTLAGSWQLLLATGQNLSIALVALLPWALVTLLPLAALVLFVRRRFARKATAES